MSEKTSGDVERSNQEVQDDNLVDWEGLDDPKKPLNWTPRKKNAHVAIISAITLTANLASTMFAPGALLLVSEFGITSSTVGSLTVSIYILGFAVGPLVLAPLSELYGRLVIYHVCNAVFIAFTLGCALASNTGMFLAFRFLAGCAGAAPLTIGGGSIADMFAPEHRGAAMGAWAAGPLIGPVLGPIIGGFVSQAIGWRWTFWLILILSGIISICALVFMRETYSPVLLARKAANLRKATNNPALVSKLDKGIAPKTLLARAVVRPLKLLVLSPIVSLLSIYTAFSFSLIYLLFTTFPIVFSEQYHFGTGTAGLSYLGIGIGFFLSLVLFGALSDRILKQLAARERNPDAPGNETNEEDKSAPIKTKPEWRLPLMVYFAPTLPIGLFWYGWAADQKTHWIVPILGTGLVGIGALFVMMPAMSYLVDAFDSEAAASALAANTLVRSLLGAFLPMAGPPLYEALGLGWGNSLLGFIGLAFVPVPYIFWRYGERIRKRWAVSF
ncbi:MFS general substrate transporter [Polyplosphaeria fusca]|uniref:MFS general substrate transporter n=1 Tax=Polyplosphaeria fusca TaxID=682080 RepID=A0A9P4V383_9PLEO|nr:MFS general substrate transporter [Polyplosphaeria fusca]